MQIKKLDELVFKSKTFVESWIIFILQKDDSTKVLDPKLIDLIFYLLS